MKEEPFERESIKERLKSPDLWIRLVVLVTACGLVSVAFGMLLGIAWLDKLGFLLLVPSSAVPFVLLAAGGFLLVHRYVVAARGDSHGMGRPGNEGAGRRNSHSKDA